MLNANTRQCVNGYTEKHHILPRSLGGMDIAANIVRLTAREHYIAHMLLAKMTIGRAKHSMLVALNLMTYDVRKKPSRHKPTSRQIAKVREAFSESQRHRMLQQPLADRLAFGQRQRGIPHSIEAREKISVGNTGKAVKQSTREKMSLIMTGRKLSAETKKKIGLSSIGRIMSTEARLRISLSNKGKLISAQTRAKISIANKGRIFSIETRAKMSLVKLGTHASEASIEKRRVSMLEHYEKISDEEKLINSKKISDSKRGRPSGSKGAIRSEETKLKMSIARKAYWDKKRTEKLTVQFL